MLDRTKYYFGQNINSPPVIRLKRSRVIKILIVDDNPNNLLALETILIEIGTEPIRAESGEEALKLILNHEFAMAIIDVQMPQMDGYELAKIIHQYKKTEELPIIFLSAVFSDDIHISKGYDHGGVDFITKPFNPKILTCKVMIFIQLHKQKKELQRTIAQLEIQQRTITLQNESLKEKAIRDDLSGLYNRRHLRSILEQEFNKCTTAGSDMALLYFDLDHFKNINDTLGHGFGDAVICQFGACLSSNCRESDFLFRIGGEEFLALLPGTDITTAANIVAEKIRYICDNSPFYKGNINQKVTVSIGVSSFKHHQPTSMNDLISFADSALYAAKDKGRNQIVIYDPPTLR